jgi:hypothetical protein
MRFLLALLLFTLLPGPGTAQNFGNIKPNTVIGNPDPSASKPAKPRAFDFFSPMDFGAKGDGVTDDTAAMQAAITAASSGTLVLGPRLYAIAGPLASQGTIHIVGAFSGGGQTGWSTGGSYGTCQTGLRQKTANITLLTLYGNGSVLKDVCFDAPGVNNTSGAAVQVINFNATTPAHNILIEGNQFNGFCNSVDATAVATGGAQIVGTHIVRNSFQPVNNTGCHAIWIGRLSPGGKTTDTHILENSIFCPFDGAANQSVANVDGVYLTDSGGSNIRGNDIVACLHGTYLFPGANQAVNGFFFNSTIPGDSSKVNDLLIDTAAATGTVAQGKIVGSWMASALATSVVVQNTGGGTVRGIHFVGDTFYPRQNVNGVDVLAGDDITFTGGAACAMNVSSGTMLNIVTAGSVGIHDMVIGACDSTVAGYTIQKGISYHPATAGKISITGNQIYGTDAFSPVLQYAPGVPPTSAVIANNVGVDDIATITVASAATINIPVNPSFTITGNAAISTINGGWPGRCVNIVPAGAWTTVTGGNINPAVVAVTGVMKQACFSGTTWYFQ